VTALLELGLVVEAAGRLVPRARIVPTEGLYLTYDGFSEGLADPPGWVASFTPTAYWLASLTPRRLFARALDIGTGNGAHALFAARHAGHVVATDINPRALAFTAISAALNGLENVETRLGSLFEPVAGEEFDLITCNAPYVISPEQRWQYRDAGAPGDEFSEQVVRQAARHLAEDGFASVVVSWLAASEDDPDEHVHAWLERSGCDAWIVGLRGADPPEHAAGWNEHLVGDPHAFVAALDQWEAYFDSLGASWISEGAVILHRRDVDAHLVTADPVDEDDLEAAGDQIERVFAGLALLATGGDEALLDRRPRLAEAAWFEEELDGTGVVTAVRAMLDEGTHPEVEIEPSLLETIASLDGTTQVPPQALDVVRELLVLGYLDI
jgi:SAM-dependent methyltransferase